METKNACNRKRERRQWRISKSRGRWKKPTHTSTCEWQFVIFSTYVRSVLVTLADFFAWWVDWQTAFRVQRDRVGGPDSALLY